MTSASRLARGRVTLLSLLGLMILAAAYVTAGNSPFFASTAQPGGVLLIADLRGHALIVVDVERPEEQRRIALPGGPHEIVRLEDGRIVASLERQGTLALVDTDAETVTTVAVGGIPHGLAVRDGVLYMTDRSAGFVRRLRVEDWFELTPVEGGQWPHAVVALPDGSAVTVSAADSSLHIGDQTLSVSELPETVALSPDASRIAVAGALGGIVEVFEVGGAPLLRVAVDGRPVRALFGPAGDVLAVALSADAAVALIDGDGVVRRVPVTGVPDGLAFNASGDFLFAADLFGGVVSVINVRRAMVSGQFQVGESAGALLTLAR